MEKRIAIGIRLPPSLVERVDEARRALDFPPDRTEVIERAIVEWLDRNELQSGSRKGRK